MKESIIKNKSFDFALQIIELFKFLQEKREFIISKQLLRSATSIGANVNEGLAGESRADFVHKMSIASKEARETLYWLELLEKSQFITLNFNQYISDCNELVKILTNIVKTTKNNNLELKNKHLTT